MLDKQISDFALGCALPGEEGDLAEEVVVVMLPDEEREGERVEMGFQDYAASTQSKSVQWCSVGGTKC